MFDEEILEFIYIMCIYMMYVVMSWVLCFEYDDVEEWIVEIVVLEGVSVDVMSMVDE